MVEKHKIVLLGDGGVGKSCITIQFCLKQFMPDYDPTIENIYRKPLNIDGRITMLEILDTAANKGIIGQEEFRGMTDQYIVAGEGFILVFSVTEKKTLQLLNEFREAILQVKDKESFPMVLVANKIDLTREVSTAEGQAIAKSWNVPYIETSAKEGLGVDDAFMTLLKEIRNAQPKLPVKKDRRRGCTLL